MKMPALPLVPFRYCVTSLHRVVAVAVGVGVDVALRVALGVVDGIAPIDSEALGEIVDVGVWEPLAVDVAVYEIVTLEEGEELDDVE